MPLFVVGTFVLLNRAGILMVGKLPVPYPAYALLGITIWQIFGSGIVACTNAIVSGSSIVVKINFPKETLVISSMGQIVVELLIRLILLAIVFAFYKVVPHWTTVLTPFALVPLFLLTLGAGYILSLLNALFRDVANIVTIGVTFMLFLTPVMYPQPREGLLRTIAAFNPLSVLVSTPRDLILSGTVSQPMEFAAVSAFSVPAFLICWRIFHLSEVRIAERVGAR
jgi:lipopolysaccharide transport system permease protein